MVVTLRFDETQLVGILNRLDTEGRVAFAAACAERLLPAYVAFSNRTGRGEPATLRSILTRLWDDLAGDLMAESEVQANVKACMELLPREDEGPWVVEQDFADDAVAATAYTLECRKSGNAQEAAWAARRAFEALDEFVANRENIDWSVPDAEARALALARILAHPLVQAELARQRRDLDELGGVGQGNLRRVLGRFRERAKAEGLIFFGSGPTVISQ